MTPEDELLQSVRDDTDESQSGQFIGFRLSAWAYALPLARVEQIVRLDEVTRVPRAPAYIRGVVNRQGQIIPLVDLRQRLNLPSAEPTKDTRVIIVRAAGDAAESEPAPIGLVVDAVSNVFTVASSEHTIAPKPGSLPVAERFCERLIATPDHPLVIVLSLQEIVRQNCY